jgi:hypothetical protein
MRAHLLELSLQRSNLVLFRYGITGDYPIQ